MSNPYINNIIKTLLIVLTIIATILLLWWSITITLSKFTQTFNASKGIKTSSQNEVENMRKEIRASDKYLKAFSSLTISEEEVPELLDVIENNFKSGVTIKDVTDNKSKGLLYISLKFSCELHECIDIAEQIVGIKPMIGVKTLTLSKKEEEDLWNVTMTISLPLSRHEAS